MGVVIFSEGKRFYPSSWSYSEEAVSGDAGNVSGALPNFSCSGLDPQNSPVGLKSHSVTVVTDVRGGAVGTVSATSETHDGWGLEMMTGPASWVSDTPVLSQGNLTLEETVTWYDSAVQAKHGSTALPTPFVHPSLTRLKVNVPASTDSVWTAFKRLLAANSLGVAYVKGRLCLFPSFTESDLTDLRARAASFSVSEDDTEATPEVSCYVYHRRDSLKSEVVYPPSRTLFPSSSKSLVPSTFTPEVLSVGANEIVERTLQTGVELTHLNPMHALTSEVFDRSGAGMRGAGGYVVIGSDNLPITPAMWGSLGGGLSVRIDPEDSTRIIVTLRGANIPWLAPFRIAESDGEKEYPALVIKGYGTFVDIQEVFMRTPFPGKGEPRRIDNPAIDSMDKAFDAMARVAAEAGGTKVSLAWDGELPLDMQLPRSWGTRRAGDLAPDAPENTAYNVFGQMAGFKFFMRDRVWRCASASVTEGGASLKMETADMLSDLDLRWGSPRQAAPNLVGLTLGQISGRRPV